MNEKSPELCRNCPNRSKISLIIGKLAGDMPPAEGCEGPVRVSHGNIVTQVVTLDTNSTIQDYIDAAHARPREGTWNSLTSSVDDETGIREERYSRTDWKREDVCGREPIEPRKGEVPYDPFDPGLIRVNPETGKRYAAFITGDEKQIKDQRGTLAIMALLDSTYEDDDSDLTE